MIKKLDKITSDFFLKLTDDHYKRRVISNFDAYGTKYDFCCFFGLFRENDELLALINQFNSTMVVSCKDNADFSEMFCEDLLTLIFMNKPQTVEMNVILADKIKDKLSEYEKCDRTEFEFVSKNHLPNMLVDECPKLDDVFSVLKTSFPVIANSYDLWLTDTSHKIRHGLSQCFMLGNFTTATIQYICDNTALVGHVATIPEERGRFHARKLLYWLGEKLNKEGVNVRLFARSHRVSYYEEIGFKEIGRDIVFERI
ncbi:MAG: hypothetical protein E7509_01115 [Ruminococcus sp.]|nr:hypothetical protein [Ruminococcus sp.]